MAVDFRRTEFGGRYSVYTTAAHRAPGFCRSWGADGR